MILWIGLRGRGMKSKFSPGNKVRIKSSDILGRILDPTISMYENMTGEIIEITNIVAFIGGPWSTLKDSNQPITIYHYKVKIDDQTTLQDVLEECLEIIA
jgi:hypothetical protein